MKLRTKRIIYILLIAILLIVVVRSANAQEPVRDITNCVYGDSVTPEVCDKLTEDNKPKEVIPKIKPVKKPAPAIIYEPFNGK